MVIIEKGKNLNLKNKNIVITGGSGGLGKALALEFLKKTPNVLISDINQKELKKTANELCCSSQFCDVSQELDIKNLIEVAQKNFGYIDLFCSNNGVISNLKRFNSIEQNESWEKTWNVNLMSHVYATRYALPNMIKRKKGYFLQIISAAALLSQIGDSAYSATKSAALSFAESLAISNNHLGIRVSAVCSQYIATPLLGFNNSKINETKSLISPKTAANRIIKDVELEKFLILTDDHTLNTFRKKSEDYEKWLLGMKK